MGVVAAATGRIEVDPEVLLRAGQRMGSLGTQLAMLSSALGAVLGSGIASGMDPAGAAFGFQYGRQAQEFADGLASAANSFKATGYRLEATGYNYKNADAASTIGGPGPMGGVGGEPSETRAATVPKGPSSATVSPPTKWTLIQPFLRLVPGIGTFAGAAMTWPSGDPSLMRLTAAQWRNLATGLSAFDDDMVALQMGLSQQSIPEGGKINEALRGLGAAVSGLSTSASDVAKLIDDFARGVQETQAAIRRLLDRISLDGLWDTVTGFFTGEGDDILREIANDVGDVLENFQSQVKGVVGLLEELVTVIGDLATEFQKWIRPVLVGAFGDDAGNALADTVTLYTDFQVGVVTGLINTVAGTVSMADPDTWKGMADMALSVAQDPSSLPGVLANMGKEFVAWDKWSGDHPGRAAGEAAFNIGSLFVPGGALSKTGTVAKGLSYTSRLLDEGRLPQLSDLPGLGDGNRGLDDLPGAGPVRPEIPEFRPGAVPDSIVGPFTPNGFDAQMNPTGAGGAAGPAGPPDPPGPSGTPVGGNSHGSGSGGGDSPPPDSPGQPVSPSDMGLGPADAPSNGASAAGPSSVDSPRISDQPAPSTPSHTPESSSPAGTHNSTPTPASPEVSGNGHIAEHRGGGDASSAASGSNESHRPGSETYNGRSDERPATDGHQPAHSPAEHRPSSHDTNSGQTGQQSQSAGDGNGHRQEPTGTTPSGIAGGGMVAGGMPMAPHAPGGTHGSADGSPAGKAHSPETPPRTPDAKTPQSGSPEGPRPQGSAAGPGVANAPGAPVNPSAVHPSSAPVNPAAAQSMSGTASEPPRTGPDPTTQKPGDSSRDGSPTPQPAPHETPATGSADRPGTQFDPSPHNQSPGTMSDHGRSPDLSGPPGNPAESRTYGPHELDQVEDPAYQSAVENALRDSSGDYRVHADPRTNDYGSLINDGGPTVDGRSNNCMDCSLSALSSFIGDPTVSAPRFPDELPDGMIDDTTGEHSGMRRAADWLGGGMLEFPGQTIANQYNALHQHIADLGPGSAALVVNGWHGRDVITGDYLNNPDGSPITRGAHATVVVYPEGASGPVWWDPQQGLTSDGPPSWMVDDTTYLHFTPIEPDQGTHHGGTENHRTGTDVSGGDVTDRDVSRAPVQGRMGVHAGSDPGADELGRGSGIGPPSDRFGDRDRLPVPELVGDDGGGSAHDLQTDRRQPSSSADLPLSVEDHGAADPGVRRDDRVSADGGVADESTRTNPAASTDDREAHVPLRTEGFVVEKGDGPREMGERSEPGSVAGDGHHSGVGAREADDRHPAGDQSADHIDDRREPARYVELEDGTQHRVWASNEQLAVQESRFAAADAWLAERELTRADVQPLLVQPADWLNGAQRELVYGFRHQFPDVASGETLQKIIDTRQAEGRLDDGPKRFPPDETGGSVSVARDTYALNTPERVYDGLALEYEGTPFSPEDPAIAMRFTVDDGVPIHIPDEQLSQLTGHGDSREPGYSYPFTGTGFTASDHFVVAEYFLDSGTQMNPGAEMYRINTDGSEELIAVLDTGGQWIGVRPDG